MCDFDRFDKIFGIDKSNKTPGSSKKRKTRKAGTSLSKKKKRQETYEDSREFRLELTVKRRRSEADKSSNSLSTLRTPEINRERFLQTPKVNRSWQSRLSGFTSTQCDSPDKASIIPYISCEEGDFKDDLTELAATSDEE